MSSQKNSYGSRNLGTGDGFELSRNGSKGPKGIMKTNEIVTIIDDKNESQERIVPSPAWGQTGHTMANCSSS